MSETSDTRPTPSERIAAVLRAMGCGGVRVTRKDAVCATSADRHGFVHALWAYTESRRAYVWHDTCHWGEPMARIEVRPGRRWPERLAAAAVRAARRGR